MLALEYHGGEEIVDPSLVYTEQRIQTENFTRIIETEQ